ncbi:helix-turn-helix domain-containing protein [Paenibacillus macquariensis]|uniref:Helix-turn-helix domain-containing protein n=1 Tax=Paenibacillus macquariensis TaxID=948756 RepID=A0ABY1KER6_9BACL|nr:helix-turn-helix domain-containing protein [Paenibacillus macquariensis]OAB27861.1 hypothetical protein PMSM_24515 [Paenibacillus macquariensis subsp. macquariensis]SIR72376.1 Helix-turn-helix domain-containing protein [Paenibacillus macquariensis]
MATEKMEFIQDDGQLRVFIVPVDILDVPDLSSSEKLVYIVLRSYVNPTDPTAFPSYETIAKKASLSRRRVIDIVKSLEDKGLIKKETRLTVTKDRKIKNTSNLYTLVTPRKKSASEIISPPLVKPLHQGSETIAPYHNHLKEPLLNMIDCMGSTDDIYETLKNQVPKNCYANSIPLGAGYIDEIYTMLLNQFSTRLAPEIVTTACELYFNRACELDLINGVVMTIDIKNPIGFFQNCYKDAVMQYKVKNQMVKTGEE